MGRVLHGSARTTPRVRAELQAAQASTRALAARYGLNPKTVAKTVAKWRRCATTADAPTGPRHGGGALVLSTSGDGGDRWTAPVPVHAAPADTAVIREMPALAVNRAGVLGVAWVDTREDPGPVANDAPGARCFAVYFTASLDGGRTFLPERRVSQARSCPHRATHGGTWLRGGDFFGMVATADGSFRLLWADARGTTPERAFGLWTATVSVSPDAWPMTPPVARAVTREWPAPTEYGVSNRRALWPPNVTVQATDTRGKFTTSAALLAGSAPLSRGART